jgi:hypothetical protein
MATGGRITSLDLSDLCGNFLVAKFNGKTARCSKLTIAN